MGSSVTTKRNPRTPGAGLRLSPARSPDPDGENLAGTQQVQLPSGEAERLLLGAPHHTRVRAQITQGRHPALADDAFGVLAYHPQHADHSAGVVAQRTAGEGGRSLPGSRTAPGTAVAPRPRSPFPWPARCRCAGRCRPRSPLAPRWLTQSADHRSPIRRERTVTGPHRRRRAIRPPRSPKGPGQRPLPWRAGGGSGRAAIRGWPSRAECVSGSRPAPLAATGNGGPEPGSGREDLWRRTGLAVCPGNGCLA